jgi:integrase
MARKTLQTRDGIYQRKDRPGFWMSWTDAQGRRRYRKTDAQNITQAKQIRSAELLRVEQAKLLGHAPPGKETFAEVAKRFLKHQKVRLTPKAYARESGIINGHLVPFFNCPLAGIRRQDVVQYVTQRSGETSAHSVLKELNSLKHLLRLAVEWEIIPINPAQGVKSPRVPAGRIRYLQPTELRSLLEECPAWLRPIVALAFCTGMRRGEIVGLRWLDLDLPNQRILLPQTKNGEGRIVYLNQLAMTVMTSLPCRDAANPTAKLFSEITPDRITTGFRKVCVKLEIADFRFHDLRHTAASWLRMSGADIHTVAQLLGHKDLRMAARYQHLSPGFLAEAVGKLDGVFGEFRYPDVTNEKALTSGNPASALDS